MNRYPLWKYLIVLTALIIGIVYTLPNFYGESPAVQIAGAKSTVRVDPGMIDTVEEILRSAQIESTGSWYEQNGPVGTVRVRFATTDEQLKAKDLIEHRLNPDPENPDYTVADRKSTRLNSSHVAISYAVFCLKKTIYHKHNLTSPSLCSDTSQNKTCPESYINSKDND